MINIQEVNEKISKNLCRVLETTPENIVIAYKQYDLTKAVMGEIVELPEEVAVQNIQEMKDQKATLQKQIDEIDTFLTLVKA